MCSRLCAPVPGLAAAGTTERKTIVASKLHATARNNVLLVSNSCLI
jgi:hypothetical protein